MQIPASRLCARGGEERVMSGDTVCRLLQPELSRELVSAKWKVQQTGSPISQLVLDPKSNYRQH